jgi:predicted RNA-binding Zn-ribbon protein involved in translation (DUF1610 family)
MLGLMQSPNVGVGGKDHGHRKNEDRVHECPKCGCIEWKHLKSYFLYSLWKCKSCGYEYRNI